MSNKKESAWRMYEVLAHGDTVTYLVFRAGCYTPVARIYVRYGRSVYGVSCRGAGVFFPSVALSGEDCTLPVSVASSRCHGAGYDMKGEVIGEIVKAWAKDVPTIAAMLAEAESRMPLGGLGAFGLLSEVFTTPAFRVIEA